LGESNQMHSNGRQAFFTRNVWWALNNGELLTVKLETEFTAENTKWAKLPLANSAQSNIDIL
jgi:hypothetical protein